MPIKRMMACATMASALVLAATAADARPKTVDGPGYMPECFAPWAEDTAHFQWPAKEGPFKVAVVNGFVGNIWRIQMIKTAKAFVEQEEIAPLVSDLKVVSVGTDAAAQMGAIEDFINQGYNAIITIANSPTGFERVIRLANRNDVVLVPFDGLLDSKDVMQVNEDQYAMGVMSANWLIDHVGKSGKILEVRGVPGNSVDRDRHEGFRSVMEADGNDFEIVEVVGNWAPGDSQRVTADAIAVHGHFDGVFSQGGTNGTVQAMMAAGHPFVPIAGEAENGFRKQIAEHSGEGLIGLSYGQSPGLVAISIKAALEALQGNVMPQMISVPIPSVDFETVEDGVNYWSNLPDDFFTPNEFPPCNVNITAPEIMAESEKDN
ncbi:ribose ABC transporter substrate-binding protein [Acuticoccus sediminis]|uniref:Ribose ABC transporter substrate-binding protein n=1 Tax=Acuticoccus sediminis TaxID=2184697 RepID=A0A8B2NZ66_9HYPH|nr:sugar ABC transporter substrate-binding protein [Acuticoccus sediminis]RAI03176.1 ribose ABC transporter substrate-binding protein [Acuticoccus sediminis]